MVSTRLSAFGRIENSISGISTCPTTAGDGSARDWRKPKAHMDESCKAIIDHHRLFQGLFLGSSRCFETFAALVTRMVRSLIPIVSVTYIVASFDQPASQPVICPGHTSREGTRASARPHLCAGSLQHDAPQVFPFRNSEGEALPVPRPKVDEPRRTRQDSSLKGYQHGERERKHR